MEKIKTTVTSGEGVAGAGLTDGCMGGRARATLETKYHVGSATTATVMQKRPSRPPGDKETAETSQVPE